MADIDYRPRSATEILDASFRLLRDNYSSFVILSAVAYFPLAAFTILFSRYTGISDDPAVPTFNWNMPILMIVQLVFFQVINAIVSILASRAYLDEPLDPGSTWKAVLPRLGTIILTGLGFSVGFAIGFIFLILPAIYYYTRYGLAPLIAALEGTSVTESFDRSSFLSRGQKLHILGTTILAVILYFILSIGFAVVSLQMPSALIRMAVSFLGTVLIWPAIPMFQTVLYYDLRIRAEGYDVDLMSRKLDAVPGVPAEPAI
ncbi:MAG TPA: hypothetical protein VF042_16225 [Gemmatimonadaceae bacterium]